LKLRIRKPVKGSKIIHESSINSTAQLLKKTLTKISVSDGVSDKFCEELSCFLNRSYSTRNRAFHTIHHAQDVARVTSESPTAQLAALFHDVVYFQVDWARRPELRNLFSPFEITLDKKLIIPNTNDTWAAALLDVFGYNEGDELHSLRGLNELLSAWVAIQKLRGKISTLKLLKVVACIQATIPVWSYSNFKDAPFRLKHNIQVAANRIRIKIPTGFLDEALAEATEVANQDVMSFAAASPRTFLYNSWSLIAESNPALQGPHFTISQYKEAIAKMTNFITNLNPELIFRQFNNRPDTSEMNRLRDMATTNLRVGAHYLQLRLTEVCIVDAIAQMSGGDGPLEMFVGPRIHRRGDQAHNIEAFLKGAVPKLKRNHDEVKSLLAKESAFRSSFDSKGAPIASYLFHRLTDTESEIIFNLTHQYLRGEISSETYLIGFRPELIREITLAVANVASTRKSEIEKLAHVQYLRINAA
jgi:hypothetical protein